MKANNSICGAGIAPSVTFGGRYWSFICVFILSTALNFLFASVSTAVAVRLVGPKLLDEFETGKALVFKYNEVDISSNSWRMRDSGRTVWFNGLYSLASMKVAITKVVSADRILARTKLPICQLQESYP